MDAEFQNRAAAPHWEEYNTLLLDMDGTVLDLAFWQQLETYLGFEREHTMFVDDSIPVLNAAVEFGIGAVVAIREPDSGMPAKDTQGHHSITGVGFWR